MPVTAEKLAINAVMAGCLPMHFPVVLTAWTAMMQEDFLLHGATSCTGGCAVLVVLNGPIRLELGANGTFNALGNSDRATSVIGRAIRLCLINILEVRPGGIDRSTLGHPGKFSYCIAEDEEDSTWLSLSEQRGLPTEASAVTVMAAGAPRQIMNEWTTKPEEILETFAAEMRANLRHYSIYRRQLRPDHSQAVARASASRRLDQDRHRRASSMSARASIAANGPMSARARSCATAATASTRRWTRPTSFWSSRPAARPAASAPSSRRGSATRAMP